MRQRVLTGVVFALVMAALVLPGYWWPYLPLMLLLLVHWLASAELAAAFAGQSPGPSRLAVHSGLILLLIVPLLAAAGLPVLLAISLLSGLLWLLMLLILIVSLIRSGPDQLPAALVGAALLAYLTLPLTAGAVLLFQFEQGWVWFVIGLFSPWVSDVAAFFAGSLFGRRKIVPRISPKKTVAGFVGGLAGSVVLLTPLLLWLSADARSAWLRWTIALIAPLLLSVAAQFGDWLASGIKRCCGLKDFGHLLPGHGGVMDRFDSALLTLPFALVLAVAYNFLIN
ncbi:MAG: phosphatidate cytidylyltransferase [Eubacteriales bacterium]|nr:phosphatidate cytidylyltransferase [Eubacteriales bacterium]